MSRESYRAMRYIGKPRRLNKQPHDFIGWLIALIVMALAIRTLFQHL